MTHKYKLSPTYHRIYTNKMNNFLRLFYKVTLIFLFFGYALSPLTATAKSPQKNQMVADIHFKDMQGKAHHLAEYRGKWLFLNFWAGYCDICRKEIPTLIRFQQNNRNKVTILGISYGGETRQDVKAAMARYKFNYEIIPGQANITRLFNDVIATPTTIVISPEGRMVAKAIGEQSTEELNAFISSNDNEEVRWIWDY